MFSTRTSIVEPVNGAATQQKADPFREGSFKIFESVRMAFTEIAFVNRGTPYEKSFSRFHLTKNMGKAAFGWSDIDVKKTSTTSRAISSTFENKLLKLKITVFVSLSAYDDRKRLQTQNYSSKILKIQANIKVKRHPLPSGQVVLRSVLFGEKLSDFQQNSTSNDSNKVKLSPNGWMSWDANAKVTAKTSKKTAIHSTNSYSESYDDKKLTKKNVLAKVITKIEPENFKMLNDNLAISKDRQVAILFFFDASDAEEITWACQLGFSDEGVAKYLISTSTAESKYAIFGCKKLFDLLKKVGITSPNAHFTQRTLFLVAFTWMWLLADLFFNML